MKSLLHRKNKNAPLFTTGLEYSPTSVGSSALTAPVQSRSCPSASAVSIAAVSISCKSMPARYRACPISSISPAPIHSHTSNNQSSALTAAVRRIRAPLRSHPIEFWAHAHGVARNKWLTCCHPASQRVIATRSQAFPAGDSPSSREQTADCRPLRCHVCRHLRWGHCSWRRSFQEFFFGAFSERKE
jgi:hypothetical protein